MYRFYINDTLVPTPINWDESSILIEKDDIIKGILYTHSSDLEFHGSGYDLIRASYDDALCNRLTIRIEHKCSNGDFESIFDGLIFVSGCTFNLRKCTVLTEIVDNTYNGKIKGNRKIKAYVDMPQSKNDVTITAAPEKNGRLFDPTGTYAYTSRQVYLVYDVFRFLIDFMTDGEVDFDSTAFGSGGEFEGWTIATGQAIRDITVESAPYVSFQEVFEEIDKRANIAFYIDDAGVKPKIWVEKYEDVFIDEELMSLTDVPDVKESVEEDLLYSKIVFGSSKTQESEALTYSFPDIRFISHKEEEYHVLGTCNIDNELNLVGRWIVDSNVIELILGGDESYDKDIVLYEAEAPFTTDATAIAYDDFPPEYVYNVNLTNRAIADRYLGAIPNSIAAFLGDNNDHFIATRTDGGSYDSISYGVSPVDFPTEVSDPNGNYNNTTYRYVAPELGYYLFNVVQELANVIFLDFTSSALRFTVRMVHKDSGGTTLLSREESRDLDEAPGGTYTINFSAAFNMAATDYVIVEYDVSKVGTSGEPIEFEVTTGTFKTLIVATGGGIFQEYDPNDIKIINYSFQYPLSYTEFKALLANSRKYITISSDNFTDAGYIQRAEYKVKTGVTEWTLIKSRS